MITPRPWFIYIAVIGTFIYHELSISSAEAAPTYNFIANQRPRFQIPHGNLSYYRSPQWEVLYYLKFGVFPFYSSSSPYLNRTQYLNRIRLIKTMMDGKTSPGDDNGSSTEGAESYNEMAHHLSEPTTSIPEPPTYQTLNSLEEGKMSRSYYYPMAQLKKNVYQQHQGKWRQNEDSKDKRKEVERQKDAPPPESGRESLDGLEPLAFDYFLVDGDPSWFKHRYAKQAGNIFSDGLDAGSVLDGMDHGGMTAEMTIERKVGRKFQTQGWKKKKK